MTNRHDDTSPHPPRPAPDANRPDPTEEGLVGARESGSIPTPIRRRAAELTEDGRFRTGRLAGLTMLGAILTLSWPVLLESFLNSLVGLTDTVLAAGLGIHEADAIAGASYFMWFIGLIIMAIGVGATALISRAIGAGRIASANTTLGQSTLLAVTCGVAVAALVALLAQPVAGLLSMTDRAADAFSTYMLVIAAGVPFASVLFIMSACARGAGDTRRPLYAMAARNVVNIAFSVLLSGVDLSRSTLIDGEAVTQVIIANPSPFNLGILGIALGTVAGDLVGAAILFRMAWSGTWGITLYRRRLKPHWTTIKRLARLGWPNFLETAGMWVGNFLVVIMVGGIAASNMTGNASGVLGAHIIAIRIEAMSFLAGFAMGTAAATLAGQYLGARRPDMAKKAIWRCTIIGAAVMLSFGVVFILFPRQLTGLLSAQPEHLELTPPLLIICGVVQIPFALGIVLRSALRGAGDVKAVMALTWISTYAIRLPLAFLFSGADLRLFPAAAASQTATDAITYAITIPNPMPDDFPIHGLWGLWIGLCTDLLLRGLMFLARFLQGGWSKSKV